VKARWLVAKYLPDLRRREPDNVGVILLVNGGVHLRFVGERDGRLDGRARSFQAWVDYWTHVATNTRFESLASKLTAPLGDASYFIEAGGERIFGDRTTPEEMLDDLYTTLIEPSSDRRSVGVRRLAENVFGRLAIRDRIQTDVLLEIDDDALRFDYRHDGARPTLMQGVSLVNADDRSWDNVHRVAYELAKATGSAVVHQAIALVNPRAHDKDLDRQLRVLMQHAEVVDVSNEAVAAGHLRGLLELAYATHAISR
jgi:hypothetical protein